MYGTFHTISNSFYTEQVVVSIVNETGERPQNQKSEGCYNEHEDQN